MKKLLMAMLPGIFIFMSACSSKEEFSGYVIGIDTSYEPFIIYEEEEWKGIDIELLEAISRDQGFEYRLKPLGLSESLKALDEGEVDAVMSALSMTDQRKEKYDFSDPYYDSKVVVAYDASRMEISTYEELANLKAGVKNCLLYTSRCV